MENQNQARNDYFNYLENVLGIKAILQDKKSSINSTKTELLICVENYESYVLEELDLLQKMVTSVKVDPSRLMIVDFKQQNEIQKQVCVLLLDENKIINIEARVVVQTFSPRVLLRQPELKKTAWKELQKVLHFFQETLDVSPKS